MISNDDLYRLSCLHFVLESNQLPDGCDSDRFYHEGLIAPIPRGWKLTPLGEKTVREWECIAQGLTIEP